MRLTLCVVGVACALTLTAESAIAQTAPAPQEQLGALAPANLKKPRAKAPFDLTGTWFVDLSKGFDTWRSGPPYPKFKGEGAKAFAESEAAKKKGQDYRDWIGQCYPAGMPVIMTRVWPIAMIQLPTAVYMISGFENEIRIIYLDGRKHTPADEVVRTFDGESIGRWEGDTLVVDTVGFNERFWFDRSGNPHTDQLRTIEKFTRLDTATLRYELTIDDPGAYTAPFTGHVDLRLEEGTELFEYVCQQSNFAAELMVGAATSVDRSSPIVP